MEDIGLEDFEGPDDSQQSENATNYFRLVQLTMLEGTNVVRKVILDRIQRHKTLQSILADRKHEFLQRKSRFNRQQLDVLYPASGHVDLAKIDLGLWFALARKLEVLQKTYVDVQHTEATGYINDTTPLLGTHVEWHQDLATIHAVRNNLFHLAKPEMETDTFDDQWNRVTEALFRLDPDLDPGVIERYRTAELNQKAVNEFRAMIKEQCLDERCEDLAEDVHKRNRVIQLILLVDALALLIILVAFLLFYLLFKLPHTCDKNLEYRVVGTLGGLYFMPRNGWGAAPEIAGSEHLSQPVPYIVYAHTAEMSQCSVTEECCNIVKNLQYQQMNDGSEKSDDIAYHYLIDNKGVIYEGRNVTKLSSAVKGCTRNVTSVAFIGNFMYQSPTVEALGAFDLLIAYLTDKKFVARNYIIHAMCECMDTTSPGRILYNEISKSTLRRVFGHVRHRPDHQCYF